MTDLVKGVADLRLPFPPAQIGHLPRAGITLEYVGHGAVTSRLLDVDPEWTWEPVSYDEQGQPALVRDDDGNPIGLWIKLTVLGVSRLGFGSCPGSQFEAEKVLIGDAIRNAAMRFGVALDLWVKGHAEDDEKVTANDTRQRARSSKGGPKLCGLCGKSLAGSEAKWHEGKLAHPECIENASKAVEGVGNGSAAEGITDGLKTTVVPVSSADASEQTALEVK